MPRPPERRKDYFTGFRHDVLDLIPPDTQRLLSVGCGEGATEAYLKQEIGMSEVVGVELDPTVAACTASNIDRVFVGNTEKIELPYSAGHFDTILYLDVLEHLIDPWGLLKRHVNLLRNGGTVIVSLPNVRYYYSLLRLLFGEWRYSNRGLMDWSHLRYFTLGTAKQMLVEAGLVIRRVRRRYRLMDSPGQALFTRGLKRVLDALNRRLTRWRVYDYLPYFREFIAFQYIIVASKPAAR